MKRKRRHLSAELKARIAKEALREETSIQQIAQDNDIAPSQVSAWKKELEERVAEIFERKNGVNEDAKREEKRAARFERKVGQLLIEKEFLEKKCEQLGIFLSERQRSRRSTENYRCADSASCSPLIATDLGARQPKLTEQDERIMGIGAMVPQPGTSKPNQEHVKYPYLLRNRVISEVDEVWCADITYIPMARGHAYLVAIMDWHSRAVLSWELSNTMDSAFCVRALKRAIQSTGRTPSLFTTPTKAVSLPGETGSRFSKPTVSRSAWMGKVDGWTTYLSSGSGEA